ncbi:lipocalin-like domain protein [Stenotrophomonas panacihumi]|uniref:Lipocalin-like domain protein n=1 Tax=Stenotrophomonas panacihumi TaxID=676599 RepID=A0A0R0AGU4_9GAMM|nr:lipocalin-like domain-containing protein [Stenotrophomonas panacihumi]KRG40088.1 lipocalin-like domain protein [Stenotrophomonas panacihumi]PTN53581.1 lipocalin-like domain protein [Stenotrophomonas panacihumi]
MKSLLGMTLAILGGLAARDTADTAQDFPLRGTWTLVAADKRLPNGERVPDYGASPKGRLVIDNAGRYALQIFKSERVRFASSDKANGTADEYASAVMGSSTHYGVLEMDARQGLLVFRIEGASFPNWEGTVQQRAYTLEGDMLTYQVPARPDGSVPLSIWRKLD